MKRIFRTAIFALALGSMAASFVACDETETDILGPNEGAVDAVLKCNDLTAIANQDGTISIQGEITSNTKITEFALYKEGQKDPVYDFLAKNDQVKEKNKVMDENGKASKEKEWKLPITSASVPVDIYTLKINARGTKEVSEVIGKTFSFELGYGSKSVKGSYVSFVEEKSYTMDEVEGSADVRKVVEFILSDNDLKPASGCKLVVGANGVPGKFPATDFAQSAINNKTIITSTGCIAVYTITPDASNTDATLSGIVLNSKGTLKIKAADDVKLSK